MNIDKKLKCGRIAHNEQHPCSNEFIKSWVKDKWALHSAQVWFWHIHPGRFAPGCYLVYTCPLEFSSSSTDSHLNWIQNFDWVIVRYICVLMALRYSFSLVSGITDLPKDELSPKHCFFGRLKQVLLIGLHNFRDAYYISVPKQLLVVIFLGQYCYLIAHLFPLFFTFR